MIQDKRFAAFYRRIMESGLNVAEVSADEFRITRNGSEFRCKLTTYDLSEADSWCAEIWITQDSTDSPNPNLRFQFDRFGQVFFNRSPPNRTMDFMKPSAIETRALAAYVASCLQAVEA